MEEKMVLEILKQLENLKETMDEGFEKLDKRLDRFEGNLSGIHDIVKEIEIKTRSPLYK